jgi:tRNA-dihydrouridine synthase
LIRSIKKELSIPVVANGNIHNYQDLEACLSYTKADAVMSAEALLANPALFSPLPPSLLPSPCQLAREYITLATQLAPTLPTNFKYLRQHVGNMLLEYLAPHRRSYLKLDSSIPPAHADLWFKLKEASDLQEIEEVILELEERLLKGIEFSRKKSEGEETDADTLDSSVLSFMFD